MKHKKLPAKRGRPRSDDTKLRAQLFEATVFIFLDQGFHAARIEDIVGKARTGKGTFYRFFRNKEDAFLQILEDFFSEVRGTLGWVAENIKSTSPREVFQAETERFFSTFMENKKIATLILREGRSAGPEVESKIADFYKEMIEISTATLEFAVNLKILPQFNPRIGAICIIGAIEKVYEQWLLGELKDPKEQIVRETSFFLQRGCGLS